MRWNPAQLRDALHAIDANPDLGLHIIDAPKSTNVPVQTSLSNLLSQDGAYLIVGGFGGLGRSIATFLVENGARSIIIWCRQPIRKERSSFVSALKEKGATSVSTHQVDVTDPKAVRSSFASIKRKKITISGMIYCAAAIKVMLSHLQVA